MTQTTPVSTRARRLTGAVIFALVAVGLVIGSMDTVIGWLVPMSAIGGGLVATLLVTARSRSPHNSFAMDAFEREGGRGTDRGAHSILFTIEKPAARRDSPNRQHTPFGLTPVVVRPRTR